MCRMFFVCVIAASFVSCLINPSLHAQMPLPMKTSSEFVASVEQQMPLWLEEFMIPGAAIAIFENREIIMQKGFGMADVKNARVVDQQTGFNIGSVSKTVTAWGIMKLCSEGKLDLDAPVSQYLSRWKLPESQFSVDKVTMRRLLSHTAGLSLSGYPGFGPNDTLPSIEQSLSGATNGGGEVKLIFEPGEKYSYSGGGYTLAQLVIEEISGQSFAQYMKEQLLDPLGMQNSGFDISEELLKTSSLGHNRFGEPIDFEYFTAQAAAGFQTTIEDFSRFALATLGASADGQIGNPVLEEKWIDLMANPAAEVEDAGYGLGHAIFPLPNSSKILVGHGGANSGWRARLFVDRKAGDGFVVLSNAAGGSHLAEILMWEWAKWKTGESYLEESKKSYEPVLLSKLKQKLPIEKIVADYEKAKRDQADQYSFPESLLNRLGYEVLATDDIKSAIEIFKLNVSEFPDSFNVYDSLAEAYMVEGNKELSIKNYQKSYDMNPENVHALNMIQKMREE